MDSDDYLHHEATTLRVNHTLKKGSSILIPCEYIDGKFCKKFPKKKLTRSYFLLLFLYFRQTSYG